MIFNKTFPLYTLFILAYILISISCNTVVFAAAGQLDAGFSSTSISPYRPAGVVRGAPSPLTGATTISSGFVAVRRDGGYYAVNPCASTTGVGSMCVTSYTALGAMEFPFSPPITAHNGGAVNATPLALAVDHDDFAWVGGSCDGIGCLFRVKRDGSAFNTLGAAGNLSRILIPPMASVGALDIGHDGKIAVGGRCFSDARYYPCAVRLNSNGSQDISFNGGGAQNVSGWGNDIFALNELVEDGHVRKIRLLADGRIYAGGRCIFVSTERMCLAIINANGSRSIYTVPNSQDGLDYYSYYVVQIPTTTATIFSDLAVQTDGLAVLYGTCQQTITPQRTPCIARIQPGLGLDPYFATGGARKPYLRPEPMDASGLVLRQDGTLITLANCDVTENLNTRRRLCVQSLTSNGNFSFQLLNNAAAADIEFDSTNAPLRLVWDGVGATRYRDNALLAVASCPDAGGFRWLCVAKISLAPPAAPNCSPDIDGDGRSTSTTDAALIARISRGTASDAGLSNVLGSAASRGNWATIRSYLNTHCGTAIAP